MTSEELKELLERLVTTSEAAQMLGLSLQGVHYRIKSGQLKSIKQGGKTFVYVTKFFEESKAENKVANDSKDEIFCEKTKMILATKDEQIELLKGNILFIKEQYQEEIRRASKNQKRMMKVFDSKIELLKSAFNEMRAIYKAKNLELQNFNSSKYITISEFLQFFKEHNKADSDIKLIIVNSLKRKDRRFKYNKVTKKLLILRADFSDLV